MYTSHVREVNQLLSRYMTYRDDIGQKLHKRISEFNRKIRQPNDHSRVSIPTHIYGIRHLSFYHNAEKNGDVIFISINIDLQSLITNKITNALFTPSYESVKALCLAFGFAIIDIFPFLQYEFEECSEIYKDLPYLMCWKLTRIDYALNLKSENKDVALQLIKRSYIDAYKKPKKFERGNHNLHTNSNAKRGSSVTKVYDKRRYYDRVINIYHQTIPDNVLEESNQILRYEYQRNSPKYEWIHANYPSIPLRFFQTSNYWRSPLTFMDADACQRILLNEYQSHIGLGDWKNDYFHTLAINESSLKASQKNKMLKEFSPLISQSRSIKAAKENYTEKNYTVRGKVIHGTVATFKKYIDLYASINLHPLRIPDRIAKSYHINTVVNPINNIIRIKTLFCPYCITDIRIDNALKEKISTFLDNIWIRLGREFPNNNGISEFLDVISKAHSNSAKNTQNNRNIL